MSIPVFDITQHDTSLTDWQRCRLIIEINPNYFYYTVLNENNSVVALKYYQLSYNSNQEMANYLEELVNEDPVLNQDMASCGIIFNWPENCLVPEKYFDANLNRDILEAVHGYLNRGLTLSEKINESDMFIIYRIPPVLDDFLQRRFINCSYRHHHGLWLYTKSQDSIFNDQVHIIFNPNEIIAAVFIAKQLQVIQNLPYQTPEDIAWQILNMYLRFGLKPEETPLMVGGMIDQNSAMYEELLKYFSTVDLDKMPKEVTVPEQFNSFPDHFFSPLLKLSLCVS